jgi:uncharacterized membrane protein
MLLDHGITLGMRMTGLGRVLFALSVATLGVLGIAFRDFAFVWQLVPRTIAWHDALTTTTGAILLAGGIALLMPRTARLSALVLTGFLFLFVLLLRVPLVVAHPLVEANWYGVSETLTFVAGGWTIFSMLPAHEGQAFPNLGSVRFGQILFALTLPAIGLSHFFYVDQTAPLIPAWLPFHVPLAHFTGVAHIAAGAGILFGVLPRIAATLEAIMVSLFTLLVWVPAVIIAPTSGGNLTELFVSLAITGTAWSVAESFRADLKLRAAV